MSASHLSPYGEIVSAWTAVGRRLAYRAAVPADSTATLRIPAADRASVREGRTPSPASAAWSSWTSRTASPPTGARPGATR
ncbi:alpha-L-rhamnosidase C-terminal domain-containing protein [Streptomyces sp. NPDC086077]|uniref:alpha-L-rhamnosidase C-terminal domain-containing protein n=1 Tax=Streptomyces sp. NPDC086077 TaxID=3154862 RepID=UPI003417273E